MGTASAGALCFLNTNVLRSHVLVTLPLCVLMRGWQHCSALEFPFHPQPCCQPAARYICYLFGEVHLLLIMEFRCCPPLERKADFNLQSGNQILKPNVFFFLQERQIPVSPCVRRASLQNPCARRSPWEGPVCKQTTRTVAQPVCKQRGRSLSSLSKSIDCKHWPTEAYVWLLGYKRERHQPPATTQERVMFRTARASDASNRPLAVGQ